METINSYVKTNNLEDAYSLLKTNENSCILGGCAFLNLTKKKIGLAIDLFDSNMNYIKETPDSIEIGCMTTLGDIETSKLLKSNFGDIFSKTLKDIVGIQLRNSATIGGSVYPKHGFSNIITTLLALDSYVVLYNHGTLPLKEFIESKLSSRDILTKIIIKRNTVKSAFTSLRKSSGSFSILNIAVSKNEMGFRISVGARPNIATLALNAMAFLNLQNTINHEVAKEASIITCNELKFGSNFEASENYRKQICESLVKKAILEVSNEWNIEYK